MCWEKDFYTQKVSLANWQIGVVKLSVACIAIALGSYFPKTFLPYGLYLVTAGIVFTIWATVIWLKAMQLGPGHSK
jgi:hypothetical protein